MYCGISDGLPSTLGCNLDLMVKRCNDYFPQSPIVRIFPLKKGNVIFTCASLRSRACLCVRAFFFFFSLKESDCVSFFSVFLRDRHVVFPTVK